MKEIIKKLWNIPECGRLDEILEEVELLSKLTDKQILALIICKLDDVKHAVEYGTRDIEASIF